MKKILAIFLALITILSVTLVACNDNKGTTGGNYNNDNDDTDDGFVVRKDNTTDTGDTTTDTGKNNTSGWKTVNCTVYVAADGVNIRKGDSKSSDYVTSANLGDSFTAVATNGTWYRISYNSSKVDDNEAYIYADYVTENKNDLEFDDCAPETLKVVKDSQFYLLNDPCFAEDCRYLHNGGGITAADTANGELQKIGVSKSGMFWKVTFSGKTYYIGRGAFVYIEGYSGSTGGHG